LGHIARQVDGRRRRDALDIDPRHGGDVWYAANLSRLPRTRTHQTRSGGLHILFDHADGVRSSAGKIAPGIDVRVHNLVAGSRLSQHRIVWRNEVAANWPVARLVALWRAKRPLHPTPTLEHFQDDRK
jgi:hypothetical protein